MARSSPRARSRAVDVGVDPLGKLRHEGRVSGRHPHGSERGMLTAGGWRASRAVSSFWWMSSNPPLDMTTTRSPSRLSSRDGLDDVVDFDVRRDRHSPSARRSAAPPTALFLGRSTGTRRQHHGVGPGQGARSPTGRCGGTTSPTAARRWPRCGDPGARADTRERFLDRGRMMREVVVDRDARRRAAQLHAAADALEPRSPSASVSVISPTVAPTAIAAGHCARCRRRAAAPRTVRPACRCRRTLNVVDVAGHAQVVRLPVGAVAQAERLDAAARRSRSASASALSAPSSSRPRRGTRFTNR